MAALQTPRGCVAPVNPADNPNSGGAANTTGLFAAALASFLAVETVFAFFHDPDLVAQCHRLVVGGRLVASRGGRVMPAYCAVVAFDCTIEHLTAGEFVNDGPMDKGMACSIGRSAVLRGPQQPWLRVVVSSTCQAPNDMARCRLHAVDLATVRLLCIKAKNH